MCSAAEAILSSQAVWMVTWSSGGRERIQWSSWSTLNATWVIVIFWKKRKNGNSTSLTTRCTPRFLPMDCSQQGRTAAGHDFEGQVLQDLWRRELWSPFLSFSIFFFSSFFIFFFFCSLSSHCDAADMINMLKLDFMPKCCTWIYKRGQAQALLAV